MSAWPQRAPDLSPLAPVGLDWRRELRQSFGALGVLGLYSLIYFAFLEEAVHSHSLRALAAHGPFQGFWSLARQFLSPLLLFVPVNLLLRGAGNLARHRRGSRSDYTMRRLPDPWEYPRRCLALPLLEGLASLGLFGVLTGLYYLVFCLFLNRVL